MTDFERLRALIATILQVPEAEIEEATTRDDLAAWDSVQHLNLMLAIEDEYSVQLDVDELQSLTNVRAILDFLAKQ